MQKQLRNAEELTNDLIPSIKVMISVGLDAEGDEKATIGYYMPNWVEKMKRHQPKLLVDFEEQISRATKDLNPYLHRMMAISSAMVECVDESDEACLCPACVPELINH